VSQEPVISQDVLSRYAADAAREVDGVASEKRVAVSEANGGLDVEVRIALEWGRSAAEVGAEVQRRVSEYLERMASARVSTVDVVVDEVGAPPAA
jgi:uncharacterized alkaline shock family protein YloU